MIYYLNQGKKDKKKKESDNRYVLDDIKKIISYFSNYNSLLIKSWVQRKLNNLTKSSLMLE